MNKLILLLSVIVILSFVYTSCQNSGEVTNKAGEKITIQTIEPAAFQQQIVDAGEDAIVLDVRTAAELLETGRIEGATNLDYFEGDFETGLDALDQTKPVLVYCKSGGRSRKACKLLAQKGFTNIFNLDGGMTAWQKSELPVKK